MKVYTKTGDKGSTSLLGGERVPKNHPRLESYGSLDELNSWIGLLRSQIYENSEEILTKNLCKNLELIQNDLFIIGSHLACASNQVSEKFKLPTLKSERIKALEQQIDEMQTELEPLKNFILPFGAPPAASAHIARTVCRRLERHMCELQGSQPEWIAYINRLSDYLFVSSRFINKISRVEETIWDAKA